MSLFFLLSPLNTSSRVDGELKLLHIEDFRDDTRYAFHLENLARQLSEPIPPIGKLVSVPSLPRHLLNRTDRLNRSKTPCSPTSSGRWS